MTNTTDESPPVSFPPSGDGGYPALMSVDDIHDATICTRRMMFDSEFSALVDHVMAQFQEAALKTRYGHRLVSSSTNAVIRVLCLTVILDLMGENYFNARGEAWVMRLIGKENADAD